MHITEHELLTLRSARVALLEIEERTLSKLVEHDSLRGHDLGRLAEAARKAEEQIFDVLNIAVNYCGIPVTREYLNLHSNTELRRIPIEDEEEVG